jgi:hypothetical protein
LAQVAVLVPDLLFGSNVLGALRAAGHEAVLISDAAQVVPDAADVVVIDLTADAHERIEQARVLLAGPGPKTLAFYSHVEADVRAAAEQAGFDLVVPRSRMAREGPALIARLLAP